MTVERKIYNGYAFSKNEAEKAKVNYEIHKELLEKYKVYRNDLYFNPEVDVDKYEVVIGRQPDYKHAKYNIIKNEPELSLNELLLICDGGNLCFGGSLISRNTLRVSED